MKEEVGEVLLRLDYAATSWVQHLALAKHTTMVQDIQAEHGTGGIFLRAKLLEWLECLSLLGKLSHVVKVFETLTDIANSQNNHFLSMLMQDATRFLLRHYQMVAAWPLQIYSFAIIFSPQSSEVRRRNLDKIPTWLGNISRTEDVWTSLTQTLRGHPNGVRAVTLSPDGKQVASESLDKTIKLWDIAKSQTFERTFGRQIKFPWQGIKTSEPIFNLEFSADARYLATNLGYIKIEGLITDEESADLELSGHLRISEPWIYYRATPILRLPTIFHATCYAKRGTKLTIGFDNGQVLSFDIDYAVLESSSWLQTVAT